MPEPKVRPTVLAQSNAPEFSGLPSLDRNIHCDVAEVGAGLTGCLMAHALSHDGVDTVLLDKRGVAKGSVSASTALIQYEIDVPLCRLVRSAVVRQNAAGAAP